MSSTFTQGLAVDQHVYQYTIPFLLLGLQINIYQYTIPFPLLGLPPGKCDLNPSITIPILFWEQVVP